MTSYRIEVSADRAANPQSSRKGLWEAAPGDATGYGLARAKLAARACLAVEGVSAARVVEETTAALAYSCASRDPSSRRTPAARGLTPEAERKGKQVKLRLSPERAAKLRTLATAAGIDASALVARWIDEAK